jgi:hypothetical protein
VSIALVNLFVDDPVERGREAAALVLVALLVSFLFIRTSARLMRSPKVPWWPGSVEAGGLHVHHLVFGIVLLILCGFLTFALEPEKAGLYALAVLFGVGAGLTLDEFALWLHLEDVYWSTEGRSSVDAVVIAVLVGGLFMVSAPLGLDDPGSAIIAIGVAGLQVAFCSVAVLKGKFVFGLVGLFVPVFAYVGAIRLARPRSPWARRRYAPDGRKMARARERERKWSRRRDRWSDIVGGAPSQAAARDHS